MNWDRIHKWLDNYLAYVEDNLSGNPQAYKKFLDVLNEEVDSFLRSQLL